MEATMQTNLSHPPKTIKFFIENKSSDTSIEKIDAFIQNIEGVKSVEVLPSTGETTIALKEDALLDKKFIEIQRALIKAGYKVKIENTDGVQAVLFFGTLVLGLLFVAVVMALFYYMGGLPSFI